MDKLIENLIDYIIIYGLFKYNPVDIYNKWITDNNITINSHKDAVVLLNYIALIKNTNEELLINSMLCS